MSDTAVPAARRRRWPLFLPFILVVLLAGAWTVLWFYAAARAQDEIAAWRQRERTAGRLQVSVGGESYSDDVRIARVQQLQGAASAWQIGAEFLWTSQPGLRSLRRVVSRLRQALTKQVVEIELTTRPM